jgi:NADPH:quinone reductase-like Zn-dependent oxidoreductase
MRNRAVCLRAFGGPEQIEIIDAPMPSAGHGEVVREVDQVGAGVRGIALGDRVADMTVIGSNVQFRTLRADQVTRVPRNVDAAEAVTLVLSWTTAHQMLHRVARVRQGQRVLVHGAADAVGQALLVLGKLAGLETWGTARREHQGLLRDLGATPIDREREDFTHVLPEGFDVVFDGIGENGYRRSWDALQRDGLLCAYGFSAGVDESRVTIGKWIARLYLWSWLSRGRRRACFYSINAMRLRHPEWFRQDLEHLLGLLAAGAVRSRVAERVGFDDVPDAHRRLEAMGLNGKIVLCP